MKKEFFEILTITALLTFVFWIISNFIHISWVWILSPFWMIGAEFIMALIIALIRTLYRIIKDYVGYLKEKKHGKDR